MSSPHEFLYQIPEFNKFKITEHEKFEEEKDDKYYAKGTKNGKYYKIFFINNEKNNYFSMEEDNNQVTITYNTLSKFDLIEITSCSFKEKACPALLKKMLDRVLWEEASPFAGKKITINLSQFDLEAARFFAKADFLFPIEYIINKRLKTEENNRFFMYYKNAQISPSNKNVGLEEILFNEIELKENHNQNFFKDFLFSKRLFFENKESLLVLDSEIKKKSKDESEYKKNWENFIHNYYADTRTPEKYLLNDHKLIETTQLENNYFSEFYERTFSNPTTKDIVNNGTFFIKTKGEHQVKGYANIRFFPENSTLFLNLLFFDKMTQGKGIFKNFYEKTKKTVLNKYNPKTIYFYTTEQNTHLEFWKKENFAVKETETPGKLKLICNVPESLSKE